MFLTYNRYSTTTKVGFSMNHNYKDFEFEDKILTSKWRIQYLQKKNTFQNFLAKEWAHLQSEEPSQTKFTKLSHAKAFARVMERLKDHGSGHLQKATGKEPLFMEAVERVKNFFIKYDKSHSQESSYRLNHSMGVV